MPNIACTYEGDSATLYAIIRRLSDNKVWDVANTTWATWANGSIGDYDVPLTDRGGDYYTATTEPTAITANTLVRVNYYEQAGGSPATTDLLLTTRTLAWDGGTGSSSSVSLDSRALTSLASVKRALDITDSSSDTFLTELINQVSDKIERVCSRRFAAANYVEWVQPEGEPCVVVRHWPLIRVNSVRWSRSDGLAVNYTGSDIEATASVIYDDEGQNGKVRLWSISAAGTETSNELDFATYPTLSTLATAITAVSGWTGTAPATDAIASSLIPLAGYSAKGSNCQLDVLQEFDNEYVVHHRTGVIELREFDYGGLGSGGYGYRAISYRAGYETVPDDVSMVANELVAEAYRLSTSGGGTFQSESLGDYSYSLAAQVSVSGSQMARLAPYTEVAAA